MMKIVVFAVCLFCVCSGSAERCDDSTSPQHCGGVRMEWPSMDLVLPIGRRDLAFVPLLVKSMELFWPKNIPGRFIVLFDKGMEWMADTLIPPHFDAKIRVVDKPPEFDASKRSILKAGGASNFKQWQMLLADTYTTAEYVAFLDCDMIFTTPVTPDLLFDGDGKLRIIGQGLAIEGWRKAIKLFFKMEDDDVRFETMPYFMAQLPWIVPRQVLSGLREHVSKIHHKPFDEFYKEHFSVETSTADVVMCDFCVIGSFMWFEQHDKFAWENQGFIFSHVEPADKPALRVGQHLGYMVNRSASDTIPKTYNHKITINVIEFGHKLLHEGVCFSKPEELRDPSCEQYKHKAHISLFNWQSFGISLWGWSYQHFDKERIPLFLPVLDERFDRLYRDVCAREGPAVDQHGNRSCKDYPYSNEWLVQRDHWWQRVSSGNPNLPNAQSDFWWTWRIIDEELSRPEFKEKMNKPTQLF